MLWLPKSTSNYMLTTEAGITSTFNFTLKLHFNYFQKVLQMDNHRLPKILTLEAIKRKTGWFKKWTKLFHRHSYDELINNITENYPNYYYHNYSEML